MKKLVFLILVLIPLICASLVGEYFYQWKYLEELNAGNDKVDAARWGFIVGMIFTPIGLIVGLAIYLIVKMIITFKDEERK